MMFIYYVIFTLSVLSALLSIFPKNQAPNHVVLSIFSFFDLDLKAWGGSQIFQIFPENIKIYKNISRAHPYYKNKNIHLFPAPWFLENKFIIFHARTYQIKTIKFSIFHVVLKQFDLKTAIQGFKFKHLFMFLDLSFGFFNFWFKRHQIYVLLRGHTFRKLHLCLTTQKAKETFIFRIS